MSSQITSGVLKKIDNYNANLSLISSRFNVQLVVISNFKSYPVCNRTFHKHIASRKNFDLGKAPRQRNVDSTKPQHETCC